MALGVVHDIDGPDVLAVGSVFWVSLLFHKHIVHLCSLVVFRSAFCLTKQEVQTYFPFASPLILGNRRFSFDGIPVKSRWA